jgi:hypothetical protein
MAVTLKKDLIKICGSDNTTEKSQTSTTRQNQELVVCHHGMHHLGIMIRGLLLSVSRTTSGYGAYVHTPKGVDAPPDPAIWREDRYPISAFTSDFSPEGGKILSDHATEVHQQLENCECKTPRWMQHESESTGTSQQKNGSGLEFHCAGGSATVLGIYH